MSLPTFTEECIMQLNAMLDAVQRTVPDSHERRQALAQADGNRLSRFRSAAVRDALRFGDQTGAIIMQRIETAAAALADARETAARTDLYSDRWTGATRRACDAINSLTPYAELDWRDADATKQCPWNDTDPRFIPLTEAVKLSDGRLDLKTLSKRLKPDGLMRYMRSAKRCRVHKGDLEQYLEAADTASPVVQTAVRHTKKAIRRT